jgi:phosphoribosylformylglycinamidine synthase
MCACVCVCVFTHTLSARHTVSLVRVIHVGRIRDGHATGCGSHVVAGTAGYSVGQLLIPEYALPWEDASLPYSKFASPLKVIVEASNGASDYGNKFGEPLINGFTRSFCGVLPNGERREYMKPIMFSGGIGHMSAVHRRKEAAAPGMLVVKLGGPAYRIGVGGGAASSLVQRGSWSASVRMVFVECMERVMYVECLVCRERVCVWMCGCVYVWV